MGKIIWLVASGMLFIAVGIFVALFFGVLVTLTCTRVEPPGQCVLTSTQFFRAERHVVIPLDELRGASLATSSNDDGDTTYRVVLSTERGEVAVTEFFSSAPDAQDINVAQINGFLSDPKRREISMSEDSRIFASISGGIFALVGLSFLLCCLMVLRRRM